MCSAQIVPPRDCKVVYGSCASGFTDVTGPMTHKECVQYLRNNPDRLAPMSADPHYAPGLDIINIETGRLINKIRHRPRSNASQASFVRDASLLTQPVQAIWLKASLCRISIM